MDWSATSQHLANCVKHIAKFTCDSYTSHHHCGGPSDGTHPQKKLTAAPVYTESGGVAVTLHYMTNGPYQHTGEGQLLNAGCEKEVACRQCNLAGLSCKTPTPTQLLRFLHLSAADTVHNRAALLFDQVHANAAMSISNSLSASRTPQVLQHHLREGRRVGRRGGDKGE